MTTSEILDKAIDIQYRVKVLEDLLTEIMDSDLMETRGEQWMFDKYDELMRDK